MEKKINKPLVGVLVLMTCFVQGWACECAPSTTTSVQELEKSTLVFIGKSENVKSDSNGNTIQIIRPIKIWKGLYRATVELKTLGGKQCGYYLKPGESYLIYANQFEPNQISNCGRTALEEKAKNDLKTLGTKFCSASYDAAVKNAEVAATSFFKTKDFSNYPSTHVQASCRDGVMQIVFRDRTIPAEKLIQVMDGIEALVKVNAKTGDAIQVSLGP